MWLYYFLTIYIIVVGIVFNKSNKKIRFICIFLTIGLLAILTMLRSHNIGNDTHAYVSLFNWINSGESIFEHTSRYEIGFLYLNLITSTFFNSFQALLILSGLYIYFSFGYIILKKSKIIWLSVFMFFTLRYFDLGMSGLRQMLAIATIINSYHFIIKRKPIIFVSLILIAYSFHNVSIIFLLAYPLSNFKLNKKILLLSMTISLIVYVGFGQLLNVVLSLYPRYSSYLGSSYLDGQARIATVMQLLIAVLIFIIGEAAFKRHNSSKIKIKESIKSKEDQALSIFMLFSIMILIISFQGVIINRLYSLFGVFSIIYLPNAISKINNHKLRIMLIYNVVVMLFLYNTAIQYYRPEWQSSFPYEFFFNK